MSVIKDLIETVETASHMEDIMDWELRSRDHRHYCEHGAPRGTRCFMCDHPEALLALTEVKR